MASGTKVVIDLTNYKDTVSAHVPPGKYPVVIEDTEIGESKKENVMYVIWFRISEGEYSGATVIDRLTQTPSAMFRTVGFLQAIGYPTPRKEIPLDLADLVGKQLLIEVDDHEWEGKISSQVRGHIRATKKKKKVEPELQGDEDDDTESSKPKAQKSEPVEEDDSGDVDLDDLDLG